MKFYLCNRNAIARALMVGYLVWIEETGKDGRNCPAPRGAARVISPQLFCGIGRVIPS